jgi:hypothetical protein
VVADGFADDLQESFNSGQMAIPVPACGIAISQASDSDRAPGSWRYSPNHLNLTEESDMIIL